MKADLRALARLSDLIQNSKQRLNVQAAVQELAELREQTSTLNNEIRHHRAGQLVLLPEKN